MKVLVFDNRKTYALYHRGMVPSHWLYGVAEIEKSGFEVVNVEYGRPSLRNQLEDLRSWLKHRPDLIYFPFVNIRRHPLLLALAALRIIRVPVFGVIHRTPHRNMLSRFLLKGISRAFFLSPRNRQETISSNLFPARKTSDACWGPDLDYYDRMTHTMSKEGGYYIATGKEHRDYALLVKIFARRKERLMIHTCHSHAGNDYDFIEQEAAPYGNIEVLIGENTGSNFPKMLQEMAKSKALLCPLLSKKINYCVGLSTITDAMALSLPVVLTRNPYHPFDIDACRIGFAVTTATEWASALDILSCDNQAVEMGRRGRKLAEEKYNIKLFAQQLLKTFEADAK